ncbi:hypothetical protein M8818_005759 [Zalaria obscura]|uniref:Uncharacterized protein n=1 Tax=Zalaria obscura TaxID=2024903 RepID=A0ACC3SAQ1_9PEZI
MTSPPFRNKVVVADRHETHEINCFFGHYCRKTTHPRSIILRLYQSINPSIDPTTHLYHALPPHQPRPRDAHPLRLPPPTPNLRPALPNRQLPALARRLQHALRQAPGRHRLQREPARGHLLRLRRRKGREQEAGWEAVGEAETPASSAREQHRELPLFRGGGRVCAAGGGGAGGCEQGRVGVYGCAGAVSGRVCGD